MKRICLCVCIAALLLSGCSGIGSGHYHSVEQHEAQENQNSSQSVSVENFDQLCKALTELTRQATKNQVISFARYDQTKVDQDMRRAIWWVKTYDPITAYAVEKITYEKGASSGQTAVAVTISYVHDRAEIQKIKNAGSMKEAQQIISGVLNNCEAGVVLFLEEYEQADFVQMVEDYAFLYPQWVMEVPQVSATVYPESGTQRVVELKFIYQNSRDSLRQMQSQVSSVFASAELYVIGKGPSLEKYALLNSFLMERYDYQLETSITPAYSLLHHGVGDARAFATVYAAMCEQTGVKCQVVTGTRWGEPWYWNLICVGDVYYHIDLLRCSQEGRFTPRTDVDMEGYVWDFSAYPESIAPPPPETEPTESTQPETNPETEPAK